MSKIIKSIETRLCNLEGLLLQYWPKENAHKFLLAKVLFHKPLFATL